MKDDLLHEIAIVIGTVLGILLFWGLTTWGLWLILCALL